LKRLFFPLICILFYLPCIAQKPGSTFIINTDTVQNIADIKESTGLFIDSGNIADKSKILQQHFVPVASLASNKIPNHLVNKKFYLLFTLVNPSDSIRNYYLFPGKLLEQIELYSVEEQQLRHIHNNGTKTGFLPINVPSNKTITFLLECKFFKVRGNSIEPSIFHPKHMPFLQIRMFNNLTPKKTIGILLSGMLMMMIIVTFLNFLITKKIEFLYNSAYSICMFLLIFFTSYLSHRPGWFKGFFISYFDLMLLLTAIIFYIQFTRYFLESNKTSPKIDRFFKIEIGILTLLLVAFSCLYFFSANMSLLILFELIIKIIVLSAGFFYILLAFYQKNKLTKYLAIGVGVQIIFYLISFLFGIWSSKADSIFNSSFFYFQIGVISSVLFFLIGLFYKNRQELILNIQQQEALKTEAEKNKYEYKLSLYKAQQDERNRISADMHDELGAGMTSIRLFSELAKAKMGKSITPEIEKISSSSSDLINKMNAIIWSMKNENDSLSNMIGYIRSYCREYLENTGIQLEIHIPTNIPEIEVPGIIRRNVFLTIKEALQNVVKHSGATKVSIQLQYEQNALRLLIHDNGKGINFDQLRPYSNGLSNMEKRMMSIGVDFNIESKDGTLITLYRKLD